MTTLSISLPPETEARLRERAAAEGKDPAAFVLEVVQEELAAEEPSPNAQRMAALRDWAASHARLTYEADDDRESTYEGRGE